MTLENYRYRYIYLYLFYYHRAIMEAAGDDFYMNMVNYIDN